MLKKHFVLNFVFTFYKSGKSKKIKIKAEINKMKIDVSKKRCQNLFEITLLKLINAYQY